MIYRSKLKIGDIVQFKDPWYHSLSNDTPCFVRAIELHWTQSNSITISPMNTPSVTWIFDEKHLLKIGKLSRLERLIYGV